MACRQRSGGPPTCEAAIRRVFALAAAALLLGASATSASFAAATLSPGNTLSSGVGTWFAGNAVGTSICAGINAILVCPFGLRPGVVKVTASLALSNKAVAVRYTLTVVDGTGPAGISTIVSAAFVSNGAATVTLAAGAIDAIDLTLKTKGNTPAGTYTGTLVVADSVSGLSVAIPVSVTH
jgi:hypothetical protein